MERDIETSIAELSSLQIRFYILYLKLLRLYDLFELWRQEHVKSVHWLTADARRFPLRQKIIVRFMRYKLHIWISVQDIYPPMQQIDL